MPSDTPSERVEQAREMVDLPTLRVRRREPGARPSARGSRAGCASSFTHARTQHTTTTALLPPKEQATQGVFADAEAFLAKVRVMVENSIEFNRPAHVAPPAAGVEELLPAYIGGLYAAALAMRKHVEAAAPGLQAEWAAAARAEKQRLQRAAAGLQI